MSKIWVSDQIVSEWQREVRKQNSAVHGWWFDEGIDDYSTDMKIGGNTPIICNADPITTDEATESVGSHLFLVALRNGEHYCCIAFHGEAKGLLLFSNSRNVFTRETEKLKDVNLKSHGSDSWKLAIPIAKYAKDGIFPNLHKYVNDFGRFNIVCIMQDPMVENLREWNVMFMIREAIEERAGEKVEELSKKRGTK